MPKPKIFGENGPELTESVNELERSLSYLPAPLSGVPDVSEPIAIVQGVRADWYAGRLGVDYTSIMHFLTPEEYDEWLGFQSDLDNLPERYAGIIEVWPYPVHRTNLCVEAQYAFGSAILALDQACNLLADLAPIDNTPCVQGIANVRAAMAAVREQFNLLKQWPKH